MKNKTIKKVYENYSFGTRLDGHEINYAGTSEEQDNRDHYRRLMDTFRTINPNPDNPRAIVLASGAGYGCFYLAMNGFNGTIAGEELDPVSVEVSKTLKNYFGHEKVQKRFMEKGLRLTKDFVMSLIMMEMPKESLERVEFSRRDITKFDENPRKFDLIVCDFIHTPEFLGERATDDLSMRLYDLSRKDTILSYRYGTEKDKLEKLGFREIEPSLFRR